METVPQLFVTNWWRLSHSYLWQTDGDCPTVICDKL